MQPEQAQQAATPGPRTNWLEAPLPVAATLFTALPDEFRRPRPNRWGDINMGGQLLHSFLEGPSFDREGRLYVTDIPYGRVFCIDPQGRWRLVTEYDGWPNGLKIDAQGRLFIADHRRGVLQLDPATGRVQPLLETWRSESFKGVNDLFFASNGDLYFTDQGQTGLHDPTGRVFRWREPQGLACLLDTGVSPNGLCLNADETQLYVSMTRANAVWRLPLMADGGVSKVGLHVQLSGGIGPDGLALDVEGGLVIAHPGTTAWRVDRHGLRTHAITYPEELFITNLAFGGPQRRDLYLVDSRRGEILKATLPVAGRPMASHA